MKKNSLKVGFIGSGHIAREHARALFAIGGVEFVACIDTNEAMAEEFADLTGCRIMTKVEAVIEAAEAVWVCTPPKLHRKHALEVLDWGRHLYCEKPLAGSVEDASAIAEAAKTAKVQAAIGFNFRMQVPWQKLKGFLEAGELGEPVAFMFQRIGLGATGGWRRDPAQLCGMTIESVSHNVDMIRFLFGEIEEVTALRAASDKRQSEFDDCLVANFKLKSGVIGSLQATWASGVPGTRHVVVGTRAAAVIEGPSQFEFTQLRLRGREDEEERLYAFQLPMNSVYDADRHFLAAIREDKSLAIPIDDGLRAQEVCAEMMNTI